METPRSSLDKYAPVSFTASNIYPGHKISEQLQTRILVFGN